MLNGCLIRPNDTWHGGYKEDMTIEDPLTAASYDLYIGGEDISLNVSRIYSSLLKDIARTKKTPQYTKVMLRALALKYAEYEIHSLNINLWPPISEHRNTPTDILFQMFETYTINTHRYVSSVGVEVLWGMYHNPSIPPPIKMWIHNGGFADLTFKEYLDGLGCPNRLGDPKFKNLKEVLDLASYIVGHDDTVSLYCLNVIDTFKSLK